MAKKNWTQRDTSTFDELVELEAGDSFEGRYLGCKTVQTSMGENLLHSFIADEDGEKRAMWGAARLNRGLEGSEGKLVKVVFNGKENIGGGRKIKKYDVFVDDDSLDASVVPVVPKPKPAPAKPAVEDDGEEPF